MPSEFKHVQAYQHMEKGQHLENLGLLDEAMLEFKRAVEADPRIAAAHNALGHHYRRKGLLTKACDEFRSALLLSNDFESCFNLGRVLSELEQYEEAIQVFQRCLTLDANEPSARYELGYALCGQGNFAEALSQFRSLVEAYPADWELKFALADCHMGLKDYASAESILREALSSAPPTAETSAVRDALLMARRYLEFPSDANLGLKDRLYAEHGIICLGSSRDNGLDIPIYEAYTLTYRDVGTTIGRLLKLVREYDWPFSAICGLDEASMPVAIALSNLLDVPVVEAEHLSEEDFGLIVLGLGTRAEICEIVSEQVAGKMLSFALAMGWSLEEGLVTDLVGVHCTEKSALPWQRLRKRSAAAAATSILRAMAILPEEDNLPEQLGYYTQQHKLLRFFDHSKELMDVV